jgi:hypothetical protein
VQIRQLDFLKIYTMIPDLMNEKLNESRIENILWNNMNIINQSYLSKYVNYKLVIENNSWKITADYGMKKRISEILSDADNCFKSYNYNQSLRLYNDVLEYDNGNNTAIDRIIEINKRLNYIKNDIDLDYDVSDKEYSAVTIHAKIENKGKFMLKKVYAEINIFDGDDNLLLTKIDNLLEDVDEIPQLGYQGKRDKNIVIYSVPPTYKNVELNITGVEF